MAKRNEAQDVSGRPLMDYCSEFNNLKNGMSTSRGVRRMNRWLGWEAVTVVPGHKTLIRARGVPRKVLVALLTRLLDPRGSAVIWRRRGLAATWLLRPMANRPLIQI